MSEHEQIIKEFFSEYQGDRYRHEIRKSTREGYVVAIVRDTVSGDLITKEISTRPWVDHDPEARTGMDNGGDGGLDEKDS